MSALSRATSPITFSGASKRRRKRESASLGARLSITKPSYHKTRSPMANERFRNFPFKKLGSTMDEARRNLFSFFEAQLNGIDARESVSIAPRPNRPNDLRVEVKDYLFTKLGFDGVQQFLADLNAHFCPQNSKRKAI